MFDLGLGKDMPMGLGMALAKNLDALNIFASMNESEQRAVIDHTHVINSKGEMKEFVQHIADGTAVF